ncbi:MAG: CapA family protein [Streptosporangiales bacterium]|nr:CapA family protein [Streptosporangiales bacterium]
MTEGEAQVAVWGGRRAIGAAFLGLSLFAASACGSGAEAGEDGGPSPASLDKAGESASPSTEPRKPITLAFAGDLSFQGTLRKRLDDPARALGPAASALGRANLSMVNLETAVTSVGIPAPKPTAFRAPKSAFTALREAGVDVTTMANDHGMDYGQTGLRDTLREIDRAGHPVVGVGQDAADAFRPYIATAKDSRVAFIAATQLFDENLAGAWTASAAQGGMASTRDLARLLAAVREARAKADVVVVYLHWGRASSGCPSPEQRRLADELLAAGADVLVGAGSGVIQGGGYVPGGFVQYGLGTFQAEGAQGAAARSGVLTLTLTLTGRSVTSVKWEPVELKGGVPHLVKGAAATAAVRDWAALRGCAGVEASATPR